MNVVYLKPVKYY